MPKFCMTHDGMTAIDLNLIDKFSICPKRAKSGTRWAITAHQKPQQGDFSNTFVLPIFIVSLRKDEDSAKQALKSLVCRIEMQDYFSRPLPHLSLSESK